MGDSNVRPYRSQEIITGHVASLFSNIRKNNEKAISELFHRDDNGACLRGHPWNGIVMVSGAYAESGRSYRSRGLSV